MKSYEFEKIILVNYLIMQKDQFHGLEYPFFWLFM